MPARVISLFGIPARRHARHAI